MYLSLTLSLKHLTSHYGPESQVAKHGLFFTFHMKVCLIRMCNGDG